MNPAADRDLGTLCGALALALDDPSPALLEGGMDNPLLCGLAREVARSGHPGALSDRFDEFWQLLQREPPSLEQLQVEHARLFLGPERPALQPYEQALTSGAAGAASLSAVYAREGLQLAATFRDRPDHVCIELEFIAHLLQSGRHEQAMGFWSDHLSPLLARVARGLAESTRLVFYRIVADVLAAVSQLDVPARVSVCRHEDPA